MHEMVQAFQGELFALCSNHGVNSQREGRANVWLVTPANIRLYVLASSPAHGAPWWRPSANVIQRLNQTGGLWWLVLLVGGGMYALNQAQVNGMDIHEPDAQAGLSFTAPNDLFGQLLGIP
jgi:hypothetical protein